MKLDLIHLIFYAWSIALIFAAAMVVTVRNTVHGVLFLVLAFIASAILWMLLEAEFLALVLIFVYVGAVMTLFLFVVMMLNLDKAPLREGFVKYLPVGLLVMVVVFGFMFAVVGPHHFGIQQYPFPALQAEHYNNVHEIGSVLYTQYFLAFELAGVILLTAIIGAICLAFRGPRSGTKKQRISEQIAVRPSDRIELVDPKP